MLIQLKAIQHYHLDFRPSFFANAQNDEGESNMLSRHILESNYGKPI